MSPEIWRISFEKVAALAESRPSRPVAPLTCDWRLDALGAPRVGPGSSAPSASGIATAAAAAARMERVLTVKARRDASPAPLAALGAALQVVSPAMERGPHGAIERYERATEEPHTLVGLARRAALVVVVLAGVLAVATLLSNEAVKETVLAQSRATRAAAVLETNDIKVFVNRTSARQLELLAEGSATRRGAAAERHAAALDRRAATELAPRARLLAAQERRDEHEQARYNDRHFRFELSTVALEIGIVLASAAVLTQVRWVLIAGGVVGAVGTGLLISGIPL